MLCLPIQGQTATFLAIWPMINDVAFRQICKAFLIHFFWGLKRGARHTTRIASWNGMGDSYGHLACSHMLSDLAGLLTTVVKGPALVKTTKCQIHDGAWFVFSVSFVPFALFWIVTGWQAMTDRKGRREKRPTFKSNHGRCGKDLLVHGVWSLPGDLLLHPTSMFSWYFCKIFL